ncbi:MAG: hypothetical protein ACFFD4_26335, partial [Candidatus Odinarchaeota archaeon]
KRSEILRLFLIPEEHENELVKKLREIGNTGKMTGYSQFYNWHSFKKQTTYNWKWKLDLSDLRVQDRTDHGKFNLIKYNDTQSVTKGFLTFLDAVHKSCSVNPVMLSAETRISENTIVKYRQKALKEQHVLPYWSVSHIGLDDFYQVCFPNTESNKQLIETFDTFPKASVMKSDEFCRYLLYLPPKNINELDGLLEEKEENREIKLYSKNAINVTDRSIIRGVNIARIYRKKPSHWN